MFAQNKDLITVTLLSLLTFVALSEQWESKDKQITYVDAARCGSTDDLAARIEVCAKPVLDLIQGTMEKYPRNNEDMKELCNVFLGSERCIRENSRKCAKGLHKSIISAVASSIQKVRRSECQTGNLPALVKTTQCIERNQVAIHGIMSNVTSHLYVIEKQMTDLDVKTNAICCMVNDIVYAIDHTFTPLCPDEAKITVRIIRSVLDEALNLVCQKPKCVDLFKGYKVTQFKSNRFGGLIATILRIVFSLA